MSLHKACMIALALAAASTASRAVPVQAGAQSADVSRADTLLREGKPDQAIALLNDLAAQDLQAPGVQARLGKLYYEKRNYQQRSEEHTSELQSRLHLVCRLLLEKKKKTKQQK